MKDNICRRRERERGAALLLATILVFVAVGLSYSTIFVSISEVKKSQVTADKTRAFYAAEAGMELGVNQLKTVTTRNPLGDAFSMIDQMFESGGQTMLNRVYVDHDLVHNGRQYATINVQFSGAGQGGAHRDITITVDAYIPNRYQRVGGQLVERYDAHARVQKKVRVGLKSGNVFDYGHFVNNWGWFYASSITANGSVRANGQFDAGNYQPRINGSPRYAGIKIDRTVSPATVDLIGYQDDNKDGITDGTDGGIYSGWDIVGSNNVQGMASNNANKHDFQESVPMPNLSDLKLYEDVAKTRTIGGSVVPTSASVGGFSTGPVYGDEAGEVGRLFLIGTAANPIVLDGPVVVRGDLIISGKVTGQGSFYVEGNVYVPKNIEYVNGPATALPSDNSEATTEAWIAANVDKDFLGLFSKESVVVGDKSSSDFNAYVGGWLSHPLNASKEDAGDDLIPNTRKGRDGLLGTADDDVLEGDNVWTVERYTQAEANLGLLPPGVSVNDPVPGSGEDIDGDGQYDDTITTADFNLAVSLHPSNWGGNMPPAGFANYAAMSTNYISRLDGVFYTNHAFAFRTRQPVTFNGAVVSRNESIVYGGSLTFNYDRRLLGGADNPNVLLPKVFGEIKDLNYYQSELADIGEASVPVVPPTHVRVALDPTNGAKTGLISSQEPFVPTVDTEQGTTL